MLPNRHRSLGPASFLLALVCLVLCVLVGCGDGRIETYPVTGKVLVDGRPAEGAIVILYPIEGEPEFMKERPFARTDAQGNFALTTFIKGDGAPAGDYKVLLNWRPPSSRAMAGVVARDAFSNRYATPDRTTLSCTVSESENVLPPFELSTKQARN